MAKGSSKIGNGSGGGAKAQANPSPNFQEAFAPGKDFVAVGGADHAARTVSRTTQAEWNAYASKFGSDISSTDEGRLMKRWDGTNLYGYFRTTNSMAINQQLYTNPGKSLDQIFNKRTKQGKADLETIDALDRAISSHKTPSDGTYYRFCNPASLQRSYGLSDADMRLISQAPSMNPSQLAQLNRMLRGSKASSLGYTSVSANRTLNAFSDPSKPQSRGYTIERRMSVRAGTNAYAPKSNAQESEVVFGRGFSVSFSHITVEGNHIIIHEYN